MNGYVIYWSLIIFFCRIANLVFTITNSVIVVWCYIARDPTHKKSKKRVVRASIVRTIKSRDENITFFVNSKST